MLDGWKEYFGDLMNEEDEGERRGDVGGVDLDMKVIPISKVEVRSAMKKMKIGKQLAQMTCQQKHGNASGS